MGSYLPGNRGWIAAGHQLPLKCVSPWRQRCLSGIPFAKKSHKQNLETLMTTIRSFAHITMATLLSAGLAVAHAQSTPDAAPGTAASSAHKASQAASGKKATHKTKSKKAKKPAAQVSNPGTSGGAGNRSGGERKDGASFSASRPGGAASKPTGTGWD